jgi:hypothetical protein
LSPTLAFDYPTPDELATWASAHTYADLFDDELDNIATALDSLEDLSADI